MTQRRYITRSSKGRSRRLIRRIGARRLGHRIKRQAWFCWGAKHALR